MYSAYHANGQQHQPLEKNKLVRLDNNFILLFINNFILLFRYVENSSSVPSDEEKQPQVLELGES